MKKIRKRRVFSIKKELLQKSQEAALSAVEIFNNPNIHFKSETFIVLMIIAWTYLLHAYYRSKKIDYCYYIKSNGRKKYDKTKNGGKKRWDLGKCLNCNKCPLDSKVKSNLTFLMGIRHEIEHQMTNKIDDLISAKFQACCINFNDTMKNLFDESFALDNKLGLAIQFFGFSEPQARSLKDIKGVPQNVIDFINCFEKNMPEEDFNSSKFSYKLIYTPCLVNHIGQADKACFFISEKSAEGKEIQNIMVKKIEHDKFIAGDVVNRMKSKGFKDFNMYKHTQLWKRLDAKNPRYKYGCLVARKSWYWYQSWIDKVEEELLKKNNVKK